MTSRLTKLVKGGAPTQLFSLGGTSDWSSAEGARPTSSSGIGQERLWARVGPGKLAARPVMMRMMTKLLPDAGPPAPGSASIDSGLESSPGRALEPVDPR